MWTHKNKKVDEGKGAVCSLHEREKLREPEEKKELAQTLKTFLRQSEKERIRSMYNKTILLLDSVFVISRIIKVSVRVISLSLQLFYFILLFCHTQ